MGDIGQKIQDEQSWQNLNIDKKIDKLAHTIYTLDKSEIVAALYEYTDELITTTLEICKYSLEEELKSRIIGELMMSVSSMVPKIEEQIRKNIYNNDKSEDKLELNL